MKMTALSTETTLASVLEVASKYERFVSTVASDRRHNVETALRGTLDNLQSALGASGGCKYDLRSFAEKALAAGERDAIWMQTLEAEWCETFDDLLCAMEEARVSGARALINLLSHVLTEIRYDDMVAKFGRDAANAAFFGA